MTPKTNSPNKPEEQSSSSSFRKISTDKYILAGVITFLIFSLGLTLGLVLKNVQSNEVEQINQEQEVRYLSLQLQYLYLTSMSNANNCPTLSATLKETVTDLSNSLSKVIAAAEETQLPEDKKTTIQRRYALDNLRYWLLATQSKQKCQLNIVPLLYFYTQECSSCPTQGIILTYFKGLFGEQLLVFPINLDLRTDEPMVEIIRSQYNITKYPTLIIDNKKYEGVVKQEQLQEIICSSLQDSELCA